MTKSFLKKLKNEDGSSIIFILVLGVAVAAASVYLMEMSVTVEKGIQTISNREKYLRLNTTLRGVFNAPTLCTAAFSGKNISDGLTADGVSLLPFTANIGGVNEVINGNWRSDEGLQIEDIRLYLEPADLKTGLRRDIAGSPVLNAVNGTIRIRTNKGTPALNLAKFAHLNVPVTIYYEPIGGNRILYSCFSHNGEGALCTLMGGVYNAYAAIGTRPRCEPFIKCHLDGQGALSSITCTAPFNQVQISDTMFMCQWCNQNL